MGGKLEVPVNIEDTTVLRRFLSGLTSGLNNNSFYSGDQASQANAIQEIFKNNPAMSFLETIAKLTELSNNIKDYVDGELETNVLQMKEDIAVIAEQFGTFYSQALAASWYGLSVKAGGAVAGLEIGSLDPNVATPGDESNYFRIIADNFIVGRAYETLTQIEKDYLSANGLPNFGTVYDIDKKPIPALAITWDSTNNTYKHLVNGIVNFTNISNIPDFALTSYVDGKVNTLQNQVDGNINTWFQVGEPTLANYPANGWTTNALKNVHLGDLYYDKLTGYSYRFAYENIDDTPDMGVIYSWIKISDTDVTLALTKANLALETADGKITTFWSATTPVAEAMGDLWVNRNTNITYRWSGTEWVLIDVAYAINNGTTTINGGRIDTSIIGTGVIYNTGADSSNYSMMINLNTGEIHIK